MLNKKKKRQIRILLKAENENTTNKLKNMYLTQYNNNNNKKRTFIYILSHFYIKQIIHKQIQKKSYKTYKRYLLHLYYP